MKSNVRKIFIGAVIIIVLAFIFMRGDQLKELAETVQQGSPLFIILAVALQFGKYLTQGEQYVWCFKSVQASMRYRDGVKLVFGTFFVNTVAPSLNLAGTSLVVDDSARRGIPAGKATGAALLMQLSIDTGFVIIMLIAFGILSLAGGLQPEWLLIGALAIVLVSGLVFIMVVGGMKPQLMIKLLHPIEVVVDKVLALFKKKPLDPWVEKTIMSFSSAAKMMARQPSVTLKTFLFAIAASSCELACFSFVGLAFGIHSIQALFCGYVVATLFAMISFTPQGVGVVEAAVLVAFTLFGIDQATGMAAVMVYRGIVFWLPFLIGAVMIQRTRLFSGKKSTPSQTQKEANHD